MKRVRDELQDPPAIDATTDEESHFESDEDDDNDSRMGGPRLTVFPASHTWERTPAMREMKRRHQDALDDLHDGDREAHIFGTTLKGRDIVLCVPRLPSRAPSTPPAAHALFLTAHLPRPTSPPAARRTSSRTSATTASSTGRFGADVSCRRGRSKHS